MKVKLTTVIKWRGLDRLGQPAEGYDVPDDDKTQRAIKLGWVVVVEAPKPEAKGQKGGAE